MRHLTGIIFIALVFFSLQLSASAAEPLKIGVFDYQRCIQESNAGKRMTEGLKKKQIEMQKTIDTKQQELVEMQKDMEKQSLMLSTAAKEDRQKEYEKKRRDLSYLMQDSNDEMKKAETDARIDFLQTLSGVVSTIAAEKKYDLIVERSQGGIIYVSKALDITDDVIAAINKAKP